MQHKNAKLGHTIVTEEIDSKGSTLINNYLSSLIYSFSFSFQV